jgi:molybdopterin converting factor small subunit
MEVRFRIPGPLLSFTAGASEVQVQAAGETLADALTALWRRHPGLRDRVLDDRGCVRAHVNIFVGRENIRDSGGLGTVLQGTPEIAILPAVSGGGEGLEVARS